MKNTLQIKEITKSYGQRLILRGVSLELNSGEVVGLFGPNGAGKTTCFNIIAGLVTPDSGSLRLNQRDITSLPIYLRARLGIGYLPQEPSVFRGLSVIDNLKAVIEIFEQEEALVEREAEALLAEFSITHLRNTLSVNLSGGERRRLEIARSIASNPKFIMLDEPLAGIDPITILDIKHLIRHLKDRNIGVLVTDHNVKETLDTVDRAYIVYDGKILIQGTPHEIVKDIKVKSVYLGNNF
jgi:lipopolysaccharide export system ATP-binding protein